MFSLTSPPVDLPNPSAEIQPRNYHYLCKERSNSRRYHYDTYNTVETCRGYPLRSRHPTIVPHLRHYRRPHWCQIRHHLRNQVPRRLSHSGAKPQESLKDGSGSGSYDWQKQATKEIYATFEGDFVSLP